MEPGRVICYLAVLFLSMIPLCGCQDMVPHDTPSLLGPSFTGQMSLALWRGLERPLPLCRTWSRCSGDVQVRA